ncbi:MAG: hypothetical protein WCW44_00635 [archaeon]|jgi:uncharacterized membrane protein
MHKGQIFSTDLLFGMVIIIFGFGLMLTLAETSMYDSKHTINEKQLQQKTELALLLLTSSPIGQCDLNGTLLPYSVNKDKIFSMNSKTLKQALLLSDYNVQLTFSDGNKPIFEQTNTSNIISIDVNALICTNKTTFKDLNSCLSSITPCNTSKIGMQTITLKVGR